MVELIVRNYWWPGVMKEVGRYIDGCDACQRYKNQSEAPAGKLMPNAILEKLWSHISADFITKLPLAQEYDAILVVCDHFSKMAHFIATTEKTLAEGLAKLFQDHVWKLHRLLESIISDRGAQFAAEMMRELNNLLGIQMKLSTAYHPQTDGQTERINQELEQYLRVFIDHRQKQWCYRGTVNVLSGHPRWMFRMCGTSFFLLEALITWPPLQVSSSRGIFPSIPIFIPSLFPLFFVSSFPQTI